MPAEPLGKFQKEKKVEDHLVQWFSTGCKFASRSSLAMSADIFD